MIGHSLSHYKITAELGRGGMGIVYRATDTKLNRDVAIKVLPAAALASEDDRARFFREAQAAAQLSHPNIATVYQIDEAIATDENGNEVNASDGPRPFIAMEFIEGQTLHEYVADGPMKLSEAVRVAIQVADALKAAHAKDIVHRDIKSANVMLTEDGVAKVLDFGLAQTNQSTKLTRMGSTLGTVAYMSPEQARGQEVDSRTDLYSLGSMLYEMIVGSVPFAGEYEQAVVYSILNVDPEPLTAVRTGVPMELERIVNKLLSKDADYRYQTAAELIVDLRTLDLTVTSSMSRLSGPSVQRSGFEPETATTKTHGYSNAVLAAGAVSCLLIGALVASLMMPESAPDSDTRLHRSRIILPRSNATWNPSFSPDGTTVVYNGTRENQQSGLWAYDLATGNERLLIQSHNDRIRSKYSPDGTSLLFAVESGIYRFDPRDNPPSPVPVRDVPGLASLGWIDQDRIYYLGDRGGWSFSLSTKVETPIDELGVLKKAGLTSTEIGQFLTAEFVQDSGHLLVTTAADDSSSVPDIAYIHDGISEIVVREAFYPRYSADGFITFTRRGNARRLFGQTLSQLFDYETGSLIGDEVPVSADLGEASFAYDVSNDGDIWIAGFGAEETLPERLTRIDPATGTSETLYEGDNFHSLVISSDNRFILSSAFNYSEKRWDINQYDLATFLPKLLEPGGFYGFLSPDNETMYFVKQKELRARVLDSASSDRLLLSGLDGGTPAVSPNGKSIVYNQVVDFTARLFICDLESKESTLISEITDAAWNAKYSPDGRFLVFEMQEEEKVGAYVMRLSDRVVKPVSSDAAATPHWSPNGDEIYYRTGTQLRKVRVTTSPEFKPLSIPQIILDRDWINHEPFTVGPDGMIMMTRALQKFIPTERVEFISNWGDELRRRAGVDN